MAERNMLFTWDRESFDEIRNESNDLMTLRNEFEMRNFSLSRSLLTWEKEGNWWLVDFENNRVYYVDINNDEVEVSEEIAGWESIGISLAALSLHHSVNGTHEGLIDWLIMRFNQVTFDESALDGLKRTDLSGRRLSFEIVHPDLLAAYQILREILNSPRAWLIHLSKYNVEVVKNNLQQLLDSFQKIRDIDSQSSRDTYKKALEQTVSFCDQIKQELGPTVAYLNSKRAEQLETEVKATVADTVTDAVEKLNAETNRLQKLANQAEQNEAKRQEEFDQLENQLKNLLAKESVSQYGEIFDKQANKHQRAALWWLISTGLLVVGFGIVFYWLFNVLKLEGTEWVWVLKNILTKGFLLSLIYLVLNRSIKNYTAQKHLEVINRHRQNALETFDAFVSAAEGIRETRDAVLLAATNAIFNANQSGYLSIKTKGHESTGAIQQFVRAVMPGSSSTKSE